MSFLVVYFLIYFHFYWRGNISIPVTQLHQISHTTRVYTSKGTGEGCLQSQRAAPARTQKERLSCQGLPREGATGLCGLVFAAWLFQQPVWSCPPLSLIILPPFRVWQECVVLESAGLTEPSEKYEGNINCLLLYHFLFSGHALGQMPSLLLNVAFFKAKHRHCVFPRRLKSVLGGWEKVFTLFMDKVQIIPECRYTCIRRM